MTKKAALKAKAGLQGCCECVYKLLWCWKALFSWMATSSFSTSCWNDSLKWTLVPKGTPFGADNEWSGSSRRHSYSQLSGKIFIQMSFFLRSKKKGPNPIIKALRLLVHLVKVACQKKATELVVLYIVQKHNHFHQFFFLSFFSDNAEEYLPSLTLVSSLVWGVSCFNAATRHSGFVFKPWW